MSDPAATRTDGQDPPVVVVDHGPVRQLVLNRPQVRNALSTETLLLLADELEAVAKTDDVVAVVLSGRGPSFASGADIAELRDTTPVGYLTASRQEAWDAIRRFPKPLVGAVRGHALGGGCELALRCDLIVAGDDVTLGQPEVRLGIVAGAGGAQFWSRVVGRYRAAEILLSGRSVDAWEAWRLGLVATVVPSEAVGAAALALARSFASSAPLALRGTKAMIGEADQTSLDAGLRHDRMILASLLSTSDHIEGMTAALEKRRPTFEGR